VVYTQRCDVCGMWAMRDVPSAGYCSYNVERRSVLLAHSIIAATRNILVISIVELWC
jgi:hypothetical protein